MKMQNSYDLLIREYLSKVEDCDSCVASVFCTISELRNSRYPPKYCVDNIKLYLKNKKIKDEV